MTRKRKVKSHTDPYDILVGYSGKVRRDNRLAHLKMSNKDRTALWLEELDKNEKRMQMTTLREKHQNLPSIINSLKELDDELRKCKSQLRCLESKLDYQLTDDHNNSMNGWNDSWFKIPNKRYTPKEGRLSSRACKTTPVADTQPIKTSSKFSNLTSRSSRFASIESQILVRDSCSQLQTISVDLFSNGSNLFNILATERGGDVNSYDITFGTEKVDKEKTLWEQKIYHGCTVDLKVRLQGGMGKKRKKNQTRSKTDVPLIEKPKNPALWTKSQVIQWFKSICLKYEIEEKDISGLMILNGEGLNGLEDKDDWIRRSPVQGDLMYTSWKKLNAEYMKQETVPRQPDENVDSQKVANVATGVEQFAVNDIDFQKAHEETVGEVDQMPGTLAPSGGKPALIQDSQVGSSSRVQLDEKQRDTRGPFGGGKLSDVPDCIPLYDMRPELKFSNPKIGSTLRVTGVCAEKPKWRGSFWTMVLRDDPPGATSSFYRMDIDIRGSLDKEIIYPTAIENVLKNITSDVLVAVRGRVEQSGCVTYDQSYETAFYKLVVDLDSHALVFVETPKKLARQMSQPWYVQLGVYPCVVDGKKLNIGDGITTTTTRVFFESTISDNEIKQHVVAFKNSMDGDIFIGVEKNGKVSGIEYTKDKLASRREDISKIISAILPKRNEEVEICSSDEEARENMEKCFVSFMRLGDSTAKNVEQIKVVTWIHVTKGEAQVYFSKLTDIHAFVRQGAETVRFDDYEELFCRLSSLSSRTIVQVLDDDIEKQCKTALEQQSKLVLKKYKILKEVNFESQRREFKMIFGNKPVETIENEYLAKYSNGFLNCRGGSIFFGIQEDNESKIGHVVGIVVSYEEKNRLIRNSVALLNRFYPPVNSSLFNIKIYDVSVPVELILKNDSTGKIVLLKGPPNDIGTKWPKHVKNTLSRVIRIKPNLFCIVVKELSNSASVMEIVKKFEKINPKVALDEIDELELKPILNNLCIVELQLKRSPYPIHLTKPIQTHVFDTSLGKIRELSYESLRHRFRLESKFDFKVDEFLKHVEHFDLSGNSYVLVASPYELPKTEKDIYGLVIPKWTLMIDLDQKLKQDGHIYQIFEDLNDLHQTERNRFIRTPHDNALDLNPTHGICWLAARGYEEIAVSLSDDVYVKWNTTHRPKLRALLESEIAKHVKPKRLNVVVLWDEESQELLYYLRVILEDILCINGERTTLTFVCSTPKTKEDVCRELVRPLQKIYWASFQDDRVHVAPPYILAQFLSSKLPDPYRSEHDYQVPHKKTHHGVSQTLPDALPKELRRNIHGHLKMMYMAKGRKSDKKELNKFYYGSAITPMGLRDSIGIKRTKMSALEKEFTILLNDKKAHVSLMIVRSDRGAGTTTMCLQFLFKYHKEYPCAQLVEIKDGLVSFIENINKVTKLPLLLLVDEEIASLQDFIDFKKEAERRNVRVILLLIEPAETICRKQPSRKPNNTPLKSARDTSLYGTSPCKVVELRRELDDEEIEELTKKLMTVSDESRKPKLLKLKERGAIQKSLRTFAHFSLAAFGNRFLGLEEHVQFRLGLADEKQKDILAFLSLTHVYTDYLFPASALSGYLEKNITVCLDTEFKSSSYLRELLSPPLDDSDSRRISFIEVAQEILVQLANNGNNGKWEFTKEVSIKMAKDVLSVNIDNKEIDQLARKLFVTSEYETEKFSLLIRSMKEDSSDTARETLVNLVTVFEKHTSFRAHLLAHLAKYHMIVDSNFEEAKPLIEEATKDQKEDSLLHHIHGDIIRLQVELLKKKRNVDMTKIVNHAIESSNCFNIVRHKRPHVSHGYISDAIVRITVMRAAIKTIGERDTSFVDYLVRMIDEMKERDGEITITERYLLSLIPDAHQYLDEDVIDFEHKAKWKENFLSCIGPIRNLEKLNEKLKTELSSFSSTCSRWLDEICKEIRILYNALELETKTLSPDEHAKKIAELEQCKVGERSMKCWIRYARQGPSVPSLEKVGKRVKQWVFQANKKGGISPQAEFYNYVVNVLVALKDPKDREKMKKAAKLIKQQQNRKYNKKDRILPSEWLNPRDRHHINSIDSLLFHDDLVKETTRSSDTLTERPGREVIEGSLFEKQVTRWEGTVKEVKTGWQGTIVFMNYLDVRFVPQSVQPSMPSTGEKVRFCLSFDRFGLNAWSVVRANGNQSHKSFLETLSDDEDSNEEENQTIVSSSLFQMDISPEEHDKSWEDYLDSRMQGIVITVNVKKGYGTLIHPAVLGKLFFHAGQLFKPVKTFEGTITKYMVLEFKVEKLPSRLRAADIHIVESGVGMCLVNSAQEAWVQQCCLDNKIGEVTVFRVVLSVWKVLFDSDAYWLRYGSSKTSQFVTYYFLILTSLNHCNSGAKKYIKEQQSAFRPTFCALSDEAI